MGRRPPSRTARSGPGHPAGSRRSDIGLAAPGSGNCRTASKPMWRRQELRQGEGMSRSWADYKHDSGDSAAGIAMSNDGEPAETPIYCSRPLENVMPFDRETIESFRCLPEQLRQLARRIPADRRTRAPAAGGFSLVEHVCHLRDFEAEGVQLRIGRCVKEREPDLADFP